MTITASINMVGVVRATEIIQSARAAAALECRHEPQCVLIEISRSIVTGLQDHAEKGLVGGQRRVVDIRV